MVAPGGALLQNRSKTPPSVHSAEGAEQRPGNRGHSSSSCHPALTRRGTWPRTSPWECDSATLRGPCDHLGFLKNLLGRTPYWSSSSPDRMGGEE